jgi:hypothetical protein
MLEDEWRPLAYLAQEGYGILCLCSPVQIIIKGKTELQDAQMPSSVNQIY